jgi:type VI secretion system Hcp family effector
MMKRCLLAALLSVAVSPAFGALNAYLVIKGQGWDGPERIPLTGFKNDALTPAELASGKLAAGHRSWKPFLITRKIDATSPKLTQFFANGKPLNVSIVTTETDTSGKLNLYYTITLSQATVTPVKWQGDGKPNTATNSLTFQRIEWTWIKGGITFRDSWDGK